MNAHINRFLHKIKSIFPASTRRTIIDKLVSLLKFEHITQMVNAQDQEQVENLERKLTYDASLLVRKMMDLGFSKHEIEFIVNNTDDIKNIKEIVRLMPRAGALNLEYFNHETILKAIEKHWKIYILFNIAQKFQQHNLEDDPNYADFHKLLEANITDKQAQDIVNTLVQAKYKQLEINLDGILRYLNSLTTSIEEPIKSLYLALLIIRDKNLDLKLKDLIIGASLDRPPKQFAQTYAKIKENDLAISRTQYVSLALNQATIDKVVNFMILGKKYNMVIDFEDIVKQYHAGYKIFDVLRILIKLHENGFKDIDFGMLTRLATQKVDLNTIVPAFFYARDKLDFKEFLKDIDRVLPIRKTNGEEGENDNGPGFNLLNFARALDLGINEFHVDKEALITDFTSGIDVWSIIDLMNYSKKNGIDVNYMVAKALAREGIDNLKQTIYKALNPFELESPYINVTTKDNIEIKAKLILLVTYNINNIFKGTDEQFLMRRVKAIFIDEIQKNYNHDEIIRNIEIIARNVLLRLKGEHPISQENSKTDKIDRSVIKEPQQEAQFMKVSKYNPVKILIPQIEFVKDTFKEIEKMKHQYEAEKEKLNLELAKIRAEVKIREAWAKSKDLKYLILQDGEKPPKHHGSEHDEQDQQEHE